MTFEGPFLSKPFYDSMTGSEILKNTLILVDFKYFPSKNG